MDEDQIYLQQFEAVVEDIDTFINLKISKNMIDAFLQLKKRAKKDKLSTHSSISKASQSAHSYKNSNSSSKRSNASISNCSQANSKRSDANYDLINGHEALNQIRRQAGRQKNYTENIDSVNEVLSNKQYPNKARMIQTPHPQDNSYSKIEVDSRHYSSKSKVPKLVGLVSSEQISDIQLFAPEQSRGKNKKNSKYSKQYSHSIAEQEDDDDEFEDIILNRLDLIQQKVNRMLETKKFSHKNHNISSNPVFLKSTLSNSRGLPPSQIHPLTRLANARSGQHIVMSHSQNKGKYPNFSHNRAAIIMSPKGQFMEQSHTAAHKMYGNKGFKANYTERLNKIDQKIQNYAARQPKIIYNQRYQVPHQQKNTKHQRMYRQYPNKEKEQRQNHKNHKQQYFEYPEVKIDPNFIEQLPISKFSDKESEKSIDYQKLKKDQSNTQKSFKYIPMSKLTTQNHQTRKNTERHFARKQNYQNKALNPYQEPIQSRYSEDEKIFHRSNNVERRKRDSIQIPKRKNSNGINKNLQNSDVKAYTDNLIMEDSVEELSVNSDKNAYSESQRLKKITQRHGNNQDRRNQAIKNYDYRYHQKTQRPKYTSSKHQMYQDLKDRGQNKNQKVVEIRYVDVNQRESSRINPSKNIQYIQYADQQRYDANYQYGLRQQSHIYVENNCHQNQNRQQIQNRKYSYYEQPKRKMSSESMNSFKSIPYRTEGQSNLRNLKQKQIQYIRQKPIIYVTKQ